MTREQFAKNYREICDNASHVLFERGMKVFDALTEDEVKSMMGMASVVRPGLSREKVVDDLAALIREVEYVDLAAPELPDEEDEDLVAVTMTARGIRDLRDALVNARLTLASVGLPKSLPLSGQVRLVQRPPSNK